MVVAAPSTIIKTSTCARHGPVSVAVPAIGACCAAEAVLVGWYLRCGQRRIANGAADRLGGERGREGDRAARAGSSADHAERLVIVRGLFRPPGGRRRLLEEHPGAGGDHRRRVRRVSADEASDVAVGIQRHILDKPLAGIIYRGL